VQEKTIEILVNRAKESMGGNFSPFDIKTVQAFASCVLDLYKARVKIENYVESLMEQTCPNLSVIVGALLGARLICLAGGLESLAKKPSSTIQVLGAEKALFGRSDHGDPTRISGQRCDPRSGSGRCPPARWRSQSRFGSTRSQTYR
jgi:nucleolar protein 56